MIPASSTSLASSFLSRALLGCNRSVPFSHTNRPSPSVSKRREGHFYSRNGRPTERSIFAQQALIVCKVLKPVDFTTIFLIRHKGPLWTLSHLQSARSRPPDAWEVWPPLRRCRDRNPLWGQRNGPEDRLSIYKLDRTSRRLTPTIITGDPELVTDTAPINRWNLVLLTRTVSRDRATR